MRRRAWHGREVTLEAEGWARLRRSRLLARTTTPRRPSCWAPSATPSPRRSPPTSARCSSPSPSTTCRSTCSPSGCRPRAAPSTRRCTTRAASCAPASRKRGLDPDLQDSERLAMGPGRPTTCSPARVLGPAGPELTCEQCFEQLDRYVELELAGADADAAVPGMSAHLTGCPACRRTTRASSRWWRPSRAATSGSRAAGRVSPPPVPDPDAPACRDYEARRLRSRSFPCSAHLRLASWARRSGERIPGGQGATPARA